MNVCMLAYTYYETDNRVRRYAETLTKRGDSVDVIALRQHGQRSYDILNGVKIHRIQERKLNERHKLTYLYRLIKFLLRSGSSLKAMHMKNPYDVIHVHSVPDFEVFATLPVRFSGPKIILDIHDLVPEFYAAKFGVNGNSVIFRSLVFIERLSISFSHYVIISNHIWHERLLSRSAKPENCEVILNYPDSSIFYKRSQSKNNGRFVILYPGTLNWHQGVDIAIRAFAKIVSVVPNADFHIYGDGPERVHLEKLIVTLGLEDRVFIKGLRSIDEIAGIIANSDLGIVPKRNDPFGGEAFSTKTLEFMAVGVPVIVSATTIDRYYFDESVVKFFNPGDEDDLAQSILLLIQDQGIRERLCSNALRFASSNSWDSKSEIYIKIIDSLVVTR
jgi:glycosyltransferase involved in cell wall biosynthesis